MSNVELKRQWEIRIANFKDSGLSVKDWCSKEGLKANQLRYWLKKIENNTEVTVEKPQWIPVTLSQPQNEENKTALPIRIGKAVIEVSPGYDPELLSDVVRTLIALWFNIIRLIHPLGALYTPLADYLTKEGVHQVPQGHLDQC